MARWLPGSVKIRRAPRWRCLLCRIRGHRRTFGVDPAFPEPPFYWYCRKCEIVGRVGVRSLAGSASTPEGRWLAILLQRRMDRLLANAPDDCVCEFDPYEDDDDEDSYHYRRTCEGCGCVWWSLHCEHDGAQNPCPECGHVYAGRKTPLEHLYPGHVDSRRGSR